MNHFNLSGLAAAAALSFATLSAGAATLSLVPSQASLQAGQTLQLELRVSDLGANEQVGAFDLNIGFDLSKFSFVSMAFGSELGQVGVDAMDFSTGLNGATVHLGEVSFRDPAGLSSQPGAFTLATLSFTATGAGTGAFGISVVDLGDAFGNALAATTVGASVNVSAVPEPGTYALFGAGMAALALWRRRTSSASRA